jgi:hypothetical protein
VAAKKDIYERFWMKVDKRGPDDCWEWTANRNSRGYGRFFMSNNKMLTASRHGSWFLPSSDCTDTLNKIFVVFTGSTSTNNNVWPF